MPESYTAEDLDQLQERVAELENDYGLSIAARESIYRSWRNILVSSTIPYDSVSDEKLEQNAKAAALREAGGDVYDTEVSEDAVFVDLTAEEGDWMQEEERKNFTELSDEELDKQMEDTYFKLLEIGAERAFDLSYALEEDLR